MSEPLSRKEEALYREGLRNAPTVTDGVPWSLLHLTTAEWADRCRRLLATLDAERADTRELARLREALEQIAALQPKGPFRHPTDELAEAQAIAHAALTQHTEEEA